MSTNFLETLEKQIQEEQNLMFDWDNLEDTMVKQKYIDSLREELEYLKDPTKKRKGKKKTVKKENLKVSIYKPQISKNTILKEQLMTEKCVRL